MSGCVTTSLDNGQLAALAKKCQLIERWAESQNVELHFFLMNLSDFRRGQSQSAQGETAAAPSIYCCWMRGVLSPYLMAGRLSATLVVVFPITKNGNAEAFWQGLAHHHRVNADHWLDFGAIPSIPPAEFVGAGLWQLNKGLSDRINRC